MPFVTVISGVPENPGIHEPQKCRSNRLHMMGPIAWLKFFVRAFPSARFDAIFPGGGGMARTDNSDA